MAASGMAVMLAEVTSAWGDACISYIQRPQQGLRIGYDGGGRGGPSCALKAGLTQWKRRRVLRGDQRPHLRANANCSVREECEGLATLPSHLEEDQPENYDRGHPVYSPRLDFSGKHIPEGWLPKSTYERGRRTLKNQ